MTLNTQFKKPLVKRQSGLVTLIIITTAITTMVHYCDAIATPHKSTTRIRTTTSENSNANAGTYHAAKSDSTSLFNADILRIASRTTNSKSNENNFNPIHAAEHAQRMLLQMIDMHETSQRKTATPNTDTFRIVLKGFANLGNMKWDDAGSNSNYYHADGDGNGNVEVKNDEGEGKICAVDRMEEVLTKLHHFAQDASQDERDNESEACGNEVTLNTDVLNLILRAYARCGQQELADLYLPDFDAEVSDDLSLLAKQLPWFVKNEEHQRQSYAERSEKVLYYMIKSGEPYLEPNAQTYASIIECWSRQQPSLKTFARSEEGLNSERPKNKDTCVSRAEKWLPELEYLYKLEIDENEQSLSSPDEDGNRRRNLRRLLLWAYSDVLDAWARSGVRNAAEKAHEYMLKIEDLSAQDVTDVEQIMSLPLNDYSREWDTDQDEKMGYDDEVSRYRAWVVQPNIQHFDEMEGFLHPEYPLYPSDQSYTSTILALSRSREPAAAKRAHQLLNRMLKLYDSGEWFKNRPSLLAFNSVITAYANSQEIGSADRAESVLNHLEKLYFDEDKPQYNYLKPDVITYNAAVAAWSKSREEAAVYRAEDIVRRMEEHHGSFGDNFLDVKPDLYTYNSLIFSWLRSNLGVESAEKAEAILKQLIEKYNNGEEEYLPSQKTFCSVINAWGKCGSERVSVKKAVDLLRLMEGMNDEGVKSLKPDVITYTSVIDAIARSRMPEGSEMSLDMLHKMERMYAAGDESMKPNVKSYSCVLQSLIHSNRPDRHIKAREILEGMEEIGVEPNAFTYNYVINCSTRIQGDDKTKMEGFKVALNAFTSLRKSSHETDCFTYAFFLKACALLPETSTKSQIVKNTFNECRKEGKVNNEVIKRLIGCSQNNQDFLRELLLSTRRIDNIRFITVHDLPSEWSRNSRGNFKRKGRR